MAPLVIGPPMPSFAAPWMLAFLPLVPVALWLLARRPPAALSFSDVRLVEGIHARPPGRGRHFLRGLTLALCLLALAGPRWRDDRSRVPVEGVALMFVVDVSGSMGEKDFRWPGESAPITRLDALKRVFRLMLVGGTAPDGTSFTGRAHDQVGLVAFATWTETLAPLTLSHSVLLSQLDRQQPRSGGDAGLSNVGDAIDEGVRKLDAAGPARRKVLVLVSDGEHNVPGDAADPAHRPRQAAHIAAALGVTIHTVDAGGTSGERREAGRRNLQAVAALTGGRSFEASDVPALLETLREIDALETRPADSDRHHRYIETAPWLALAALGSLAILLALEATRWRIVPAG